MILKYHDKFKNFKDDRITMILTEYDHPMIALIELFWIDMQLKKFHDIKIIKSILVSYDLSIW